MTEVEQVELDESLTAAAPTTDTPDPPIHLGPYPVLLPKVTDPRMHLALVTTTLQVLGQTVFRFELSIAQILISILTCAVIELTVTFKRDRTIAWPASAMLTGNGIALILRVPGTEWGDWWSLQGWWVFAGCAVLAMASKYLIRVGGSHIFNPSNFALVITFVALGEARADPQVLWWGPLSVGLVIAFAVILVGSVAITRRVGQGHTAASYWLVFAAAVAAIAASGHAITARWHVGPIEGWDYWWLLVTSPEVLVFLFFMITDPKTAPRQRSAQLVFGSLIAGIGALIVAAQSGEFGTKVGILAGLVLVSPIVRLLDRRFVGDGRIRSMPKRGLAVGAALLAGLVVLSFLLGGAFGAEPSVQASLERRSEVGIDGLALPEASIDPDAVVSSISLDRDLADRMARATVEDLLIESAALTDGDTDLATAGLAGTRLDQAQRQIDSGGGAGSPAPEYTFETLTATVIRTSDGPQAPPRPAVRATGEVTTAGSSEPLDATFTLTPVGDTWLIDDAYDADGDPIGPRIGAEPAIEAALQPDDPEPTAAQLDGLAFTDVTEEVGLDVDHSDRSLFEGPAASSGGVAVGDYDGDGDPDVFLTRVGLANALMRNDGGTFTDVTAESGLGLQPGDTGSTGAAFVDLNGDGLLDLLVLGLGRTPNRLFFGTQSGVFVPASDTWELPTTPPRSADGAMFSLATADYDRDGYVDLFLAADDPEPVEPLLEELDGTCSTWDRTRVEGPGRTVLLRNTGAGFEDRSTSLGVDPASLVARAASFADIDGDGWDDLLVAGRLCSSAVLLNDGGGGFTDATEDSGIGAVHTAHSSTVFDANGDGYPDWFVSGVAYPIESGGCPVEDPRLDCAGNHLFIGNGDGTFTDATDEYGLRDGFWGQGSTSADFNLDGRVDLMVTNGFEGVATARPNDGRDPIRPFFERGVNDPDRLWINTTAPGLDQSPPSRPWPQAAAQVGLEGTESGKAVVSLDYDGDGRLDLLVANTTGPPGLWRNTTDTDNDWIGIVLEVADSSNTASIGATVSVQVDDAPGQSARVSTDGSFQSGRSPALHFGLGNATGEIKIGVRWPDGSETTEVVSSANRVVEIRKPA